jgi:ADP-ribose pyrophosphatase YjhB (NUDIX family)
MLKYPTGGFATSNSSAYVLFRDGNKLAFLKRSGTDWMNGYYGLPAGRVDERESFTQAAIREAKEEVGVTLIPENLKPVLTWQRRSKDGDWVDVVFEATQWEGELTNAEPDVHSELVWLDMDNLPENVIPDLVQMFNHLATGDVLYEMGWN